MNISEALHHEQLFGPAFEPLESWKRWDAILKAAEAIPLTSEERKLFDELAGGREPPEMPVKELVCVVGRRGGKTRAASIIGVHRALFARYDDLAPGETPVVMALAQDRKQAAVLLSYVAALLHCSPVLEERIIREQAEVIEVEGLGGRPVRIEVHSSNYRSVRGYTLVCAICDEIAFWHDDSTANPDTEIVNALRPAMSTVPNSLLVAISSPHARRGWLWQEYDRHYGKNEARTLVIQAPSLALNPTLDADFVNAEYGRDRARASAEYGAEFRTDVESFLDLESIEAVVVPGRREVPPQQEFLATYLGSCDPSGGKADSFTLSIAHRDERGIAVVDAVREVTAPFSPRDVVEEFASVCKRYQLEWITGDRYAGEWPREAFRESGIDYEPSKLSKSDLYREFLAAVNSGQVELVDHPKTVAQLCALERRTTRGGRESIDHGPNGHDDCANAVAGVVFETLNAREYGDLGVTV